MPPIATYVFAELGTTDIHVKDIQIMTLSMIAVSSESFLEIQEIEEVDVQSVIERERYWRTHGDSLDVEEIVDFLDDLPKPICLIAHNGLRFDFPLLKRDLFDVEAPFFKDIMCADSMHCFYDILEPGNEKTSKAERRQGAFPWPAYCDKDRYDLRNVYKRVFGYKHVEFENAEERNMAVLELAVQLAHGFESWVRKNQFTCNEVPLKVII